MSTQIDTATTVDTTTTTTTATTIARLCLHDPTHFHTQYSQILHRLNLVQHWKAAAALSPGLNVLELGCGQGDCTVTLAYTVARGELGGRVVAIDPAELNYGSPYTLGQAQEHISRGPMGKRITWVRQEPLEYLSSSSSPLPGTATSESESKNQPFFDATVLAHSLWYFATPSLVEETFRVIKQHPNTGKRLLLAEWALEATHKASQPHVLAALTQAALECRKPGDRKSLSNIRTVLGPKRITELALAAGWQLERESRVPCGELLEDGKWEVAACLSPAFEREVREHVSDEREQAVVFALRDACEASLEAVPGGREGVRAMDVWVASFV